MKSESKIALKFPKNFLWGAASAAHQVEGGTRNQWSAWEQENARALAQQAKHNLTWLPKWEAVKGQATNPDNYISGAATDHYNRYEEDFALLKKLNMNAWRFSLEWSRIEPEEGAWNPEAIEHYRIYLQKLRALGIEPIVTLWHWTTPVWFAEKGGFTKRKNVAYFVRFCQKVFDELGREFRYVITLNEPEVYVAKGFLIADWPPQQRSRKLALITTLNLIKAHKDVYRLAKRHGRKYQVSIAKNSAYHYAGDDAWLSRMTADVMRYIEDYFMLNRIKKYTDFIGLNFYFANRYYGYKEHNPNFKQNDMGWSMEPEKIEYVLKDLSDRYDKPIIITESGLADFEDEHRKWWLTQTLMAINRALQHGVKVHGYLHWSLTDNFEWSSGFWPRFGLVAVDYKTQKRTLRPSARWFGGVIKKLRGL